MTIPSDKTLRLERTKLTPQAPRGRNTTLIMALVAGIAAAVLAYVFLAHQATPPPPGPPPPPQVQTVVVASRDIAVREPVTPGMVELQTVPVTKAVANAATTLSAVEGQIAVNPITKGAQIAITDVHQKSTDLGLSMGIHKGMRAVTIALDPVSSVAGFVKPGDNVDVLCTFNGRTQGTSLTRTVLQNVPLIATGAQVLPTSAPPPSNTGTGNGDTNGNAANPDNTPGPKPVEVPNATVEVTPVDAEKLVLAAQRGRLILTLRSMGDTSVDDIPTVHESAVTTVLPESAGGGGGVRTIIKVVRVPKGAQFNPTLPPAAPTLITVIRGSNVTTVSGNP
jgi:pilus assembly protein CpaB